MRTKKTLFFILFFIIGVSIFALIMTLICHFGYFEIFLRSFTSIKVVFIILIYIFFLYFFVFLHELGHVFIFIIKKIKIRSIIIHFFGLIRKKKSLIPFIDFRLVVFLGGIVTPMLQVIDEPSFNQTKNTLRLSIIFGPLFSIVGFLINLIASTLVMFTSNNLILILLSIISITIHIPLFILILLSSFKSKGNVFGDFVAHKKINDDKFYLNVLLQYQVLSFESYQFLKSKIDELKSKHSSIIDKSVIAQYLCLNLLYETKKNELCIQLIRSFSQRNLIKEYEPIIIVILAYTYLYDYVNFQTMKMKIQSNKFDSLLLQETITTIEQQKVTKMFLSLLSKNTKILDYFVDYNTLIQKVISLVTNTTEIDLSE